MQTISIVNLKGGVGKSITARDLSYNLNKKGKKVLLIDNDKQGDSSRQYNRRSEDKPGIDAIMTGKYKDIKDIIQETDYPCLDIITANMNLITANQKVMMELSRPQHDRIQRAMIEAATAYDYDYCIIDNAPDINISVINALCASQYVIIPVELDDNTMEGMDIIMENIKEVREHINPYLEHVNVLITKYDNQNRAHKDAAVEVAEKLGWPLFKTRIRTSRKVAESQKARLPIALYSKRSAAAIDYQAFTEEILAMTEEGEEHGKEA